MTVGFWDKTETGFNFNDEHKTDIDFFVFADKKERKFISVKIDEHITGWDQGGFASINIPAENWKEFVEAINAIKVE